MVYLCWVLRAQKGVEFFCCRAGSESRRACHVSFALFTKETKTVRIGACTNEKVFDRIIRFCGFHFPRILQPPSLIDFDKKKKYNCIILS